MGKTNEKNLQTGQQGTDKPWERPDQASQDPALKPPDRKQRQRDQEDNKTS